MPIVQMKVPRCSKTLLNASEIILRHLPGSQTCSKASTHAHTQLIASASAAFWISQKRAHSDDNGDAHQARENLADVFLDTKEASKKFAEMHRMLLDNHTHSSASSNNVRMWIM